MYLRASANGHLIRYWNPAASGRKRSLSAKVSLQFCRSKGRCSLATDMLHSAQQGTQYCQSRKSWSDGRLGILSAAFGMPRQPRLLIAFYAHNAMDADTCQSTQAHLDIELHWGLVEDDVILCQRKVMHQVCRGDYIHRKLLQEVAMRVQATHTDKRPL